MRWVRTTLHDDGEAFDFVLVSDDYPHAYSETAVGFVRVLGYWRACDPPQWLVFDNRRKIDTTSGVEFTDEAAAKIYGLMLGMGGDP